VSAKLDETGPAAPPRRNGELVFEAPWQSRAFGAAVALARGQTIEWEQFRQELIAEIGRWERDAGEDEWSYYERWLAALERLLLDGGLVTEQELAARTAAVEHAVAHEHDHEHGHGHGHDHHHEH
jgi:nitrile hydratase accessory protein